MLIEMQFRVKLPVAVVAFRKWGSGQNFAHEGRSVSPQLAKFFQKGYPGIMDQDDEELGRFKPKGEFPPPEPREPFADELLGSNHKGLTPMVEGLHVPPEGVSKEGLRTFLQELAPIVGEIGNLSRKDQHLVAEKIQAVKNLLHAEKFSEDVIVLFEEVARHFNDLLVHSTPVDQEAVLKCINQLLRDLL